MSTTLLRELLRQRHLKYESFRDEYEKVAAQINADGVAPSKAQYYRWLSGQLRGGLPYPDACRVLETMFPPWKAAELFEPYQPGRQVPREGIHQVDESVLASVPHGFRAEALAGYWVTAYQFHSGGQDRTPMHHADIARIAASDDRRITAVNHPPQPRTEGRAVPFRNEITAELAGRHLVGTWRNTSDTRYFGAVHLAVLPGETLMDGYYTGVGSDIAVSVDRWRWARLDGDEPAEIRLRDPAAVYELVMTRTQYDAPLTTADIREDA
jgi:hypothetical protein